MQPIIKPEKSKIKIINIIIFCNSTLNWKSAVDDVATFLDGDKLPCLLVENKADLLNQNMENFSELEKFSNNNGFCGCFRTSAKTGLNISESMEYLIKNIIKRMEDLKEKEGEVFSSGRQSVKLEPEKHNDNCSSKIKRIKNRCC